MMIIVGWVATLLWFRFRHPFAPYMYYHNFSGNGLDKGIVHTRLSSTRLVISSIVVMMRFLSSTC